MAPFSWTLLLLLSRMLGRTTWQSRHPLRGTIVSLGPCRMSLYLLPFIQVPVLQTPASAPAVLKRLQRRRARSITPTLPGPNLVL